MDKVDRVVIYRADIRKRTAAGPVMNAMAALKRAKWARESGNAPEAQDFDRLARLHLSVHIAERMASNATQVLTLFELTDDVPALPLVTSGGVMT